MLADDRKIELEDLGGILVYGDSSLPDLYYCCSTRPSIAKRGDQVQLTLLAYQNPTARNAGMLSFVIDLVPDPKDLDAFQARYPQAQMVPMPWTSGTVTASIAGGDPIFAIPSLLGANSAVVSIGLTSDQYVLLRKSKVAPISVVYGLSFEALRDEYAFGIEFDQNNFRNWVQKKCSANFLFLSLEKVDTFEEIRQAGVIRVTSVNQTGEEPPDGFRRAVLASIQSILTPMPRFAPPPQGGDPGWGIGFECSTVRDIQNIDKRLDTDMSVVGSVTRKAYLQGVPDGLTEALAACQVVELPTAESFVQKLSVRCADPFDQAPLQALQVGIDNGSGFPKVHVFDRTNSDTWEIELTHDPRSDAPYVYRCDLHFGDRPSIAGNPIEIPRERAYLDIVPESYYNFRSYQVLASRDFPWKMLRTATIALSGPAGFSFGPPVQLRASQTIGATTAFSPLPGNLDDVEFNLVCQPVGGPAFTVSGVPSGATIYLNMFRQRSLEFAVARDFDWSSCESVKVSPEKPDGTPLLRVAGGLRLTRNSPSASFDWWTSGDATVKYQLDYSFGGKLLATATSLTMKNAVEVSNPEIPVKPPLNPNQGENQ